MSFRLCLPLPNLKQNPLRPVCVYALQYASNAGARTALRVLNYTCGRRPYSPLESVHPQPQLGGGLDPVSRRTS
ncbi:hypothetical protein RR46_02861 [Papilio xuthus]|uniref:Uncharacterized protein n=1 Tax=Papilio xuthus TaxID=66420 RepID=A0A194QBY8_PAPXU|nr:hypothetical protein RR46_02861 [Papilio xuthus]